MKPVLQALVLAEKIFTDVSDRKIIAGTFNGITRTHVQLEEHDLPDGGKRMLVPRGGAGSPHAYISVTDVVDGTKLTLQFVNLTKNQVLFEKALELKCKDRLQTIEIVAPLPDLGPFISDVGVYAFEVVWEGEVLGSHRVRVR